MFHARSAFIILCWVVVSASSLQADEGPSKEVPELQALAGHVGEWNIEVTSKDSPFSVGQSSARWTLGGRFLEETSWMAHANDSNPLKILTLMTYDVDQKKYRVWRFLSNGHASEAEASWDPDSRTMTAVFHDSNSALTMTTTSTFAESGRIAWSIVLKDAEANTIATITGKNRRKTAHP